MPHTVRRARVAFLWVGVVVPVVILAAAMAVIASWLPQLPDPAAIHWSGGHADGFAPRWMQLVIPAVGLVMVIAFAVLTWFAHRMPPELLSGGGGVVADAEGVPQWSATARLLGAVNLGLAAMMALVSLQATGVQRGLLDAADAPDIGAGVFLGFGVLVVLSVVGLFLQPAVPAVRGALAEPVAPAEGAPGTWDGTATMARGGLITLGISTLVLFAAALVGFTGGTAIGWAMVALFVVMTAVIVAMVVFHAHVGADGLLVRSALGWPKTQIAASDIDAVRVTQVNPFAEFGGWGWRYGFDGRRGVVLRAGEALEVTRRDGTIFVVTVDGASDAASVLAAAADRA